MDQNINYGRNSAFTNQFQPSVIEQTPHGYRNQGGNGYGYGSGVYNYIQGYQTAQVYQPKNQQQHVQQQEIPIDRYLRQSRSQNFLNWEQPKKVEFQEPVNVAQQELQLPLAQPQEEVMRNNYHYNQHLKQILVEQQQPQQPPPEPQYFFQQPLIQQPQFHFQRSPQQHPSPAGSSKKCFAQNHKFCSKPPLLHNSNSAPDLQLQMKEFDREWKKNQYKNRDHFHLLQVKDVYGKNKMDPNHLTATVYSQDSQDMKEKMENKQKYAQILVEQMRQKREAKIKEKAVRASMVVDIDVKAGAKIKVPDVPKLLNRPQPRELLQYDQFNLIDVNLSPSQRNQIHQNNFGFFDKFYGPEKQMRELYQKAQIQEIKEYQTNQIQQHRSLSREKKQIQYYEDQKIIQEQQRQTSPKYLAMPNEYEGAGPASGQMYSTDHSRKPPLPHRQIVVSDMNSPKDYSPPQLGAFENSRLGPRASYYAGGFPHPQRRHLNENSINQIMDKDKYKEELKQQMIEKKKRDQQEKIKKMQADLREEERIKREIEEMNMHYQQFGSEREGQPKREPPPENVFQNKQSFIEAPLAPKADTLPAPNEGKVQHSPRPVAMSNSNFKPPSSPRYIAQKQESMHMDTNMISQAINPRQFAFEKSMNQPLKRINGVLQAPSKDEVELQVALEQNMQVFNASIAQMRQNHSNLIKQYNEEIEKLKKAKQGAEEDVDKEQDKMMANQIKTVQQELDKIIQVIESAGGNIIQKQQWVQPEEPVDHLKKKKVLVNFDMPPTSIQKSNTKLSSKLKVEPENAYPPSNYNLDEINQDHGLIRKGTIPETKLPPLQPQQSLGIKSQMVLNSQRSASIVVDSEAMKMIIQEMPYDLKEDEGVKIIKHEKLSRQGSSQKMIFSNKQISNVIASAREEIVPPLQLAKMKSSVQEVLSRRSLTPIQEPPLQPQKSARISEMNKEDIIVVMDPQPMPTEEELGPNLDKVSHSDFNVINPQPIETKPEEVIEPPPEEPAPVDEDHPFEQALPDSPITRAEPVERSNSPKIQQRISVGDLPRVNDRVEQMVEYVENELENQLSSPAQEFFEETEDIQKYEQATFLQDDTAGFEASQKMKLDSFVEKKQQKQEPIIIKKLSTKSKILSEHHSDIVEANEIDPQLFSQKHDLRLAIRHTDLNSLPINEQNFYNPSKKLYNDPMETASFASGIFTQDSKVNDIGKREEFMNKQVQLQQIVYKRKGQEFGAYGQTEEDANDSGDRLINQKPLNYSKKDPFGVNMRLRQSLSSTNKILYKQDNQRYVEQIDNKQHLMPASSLKKLSELKKKAEHFEMRETYDPELFKDEDLEMGQEQENLQIIQEAEIENTVVLEAQSLKKRVKFDDAGIKPNFQFSEEQLELLTDHQIQEIQQKLENEMRLIENQPNDSSTFKVSKEHPNIQNDGPIQL